MVWGASSEARANGLVQGGDAAQASSKQACTASDGLAQRQTGTVVVIRSMGTTLREGQETAQTSHQVP